MEIDTIIHSCDERRTICLCFFALFSHKFICMYTGELEITAFSMVISFFFMY